MRRWIFAIGAALLCAEAARAQLALTPPATEPLPSPDAELTIIPPMPESVSTNGFGSAPVAPYSPPPVAPYTPPLTEPPWAPSPYQNSAWRLELDFIPTESHVAEREFGGWDNNSDLALRLSLGYEGCDGFGTRLAFWGFDDVASTAAGDVELEASTFYWDFYKRFFVQDAELVLGGGLAAASLKYDVKDFGDRANYSGGGTTIFGEGFYPLWRFAATDVGTLGRGRISLLSGSWRDHGTPLVDETDQDLMTIIELGWGLEIRHRFGIKQDKYWYIDIVPEFQRWESSTLSRSMNPGFEGTNINFGLAW
ncbi:MAG TPA: hypothetical protein VH107_19945 [Lacipirellulaceae bacterium]|jgi:hypothetical protein|nr:hypothetical protein [Lacipirellulaceae bacterium]